MSEELFSMNSTDVHQPMKHHQAIETRGPYVAQAIKALTPEAAKELLLRHYDASVPEVLHMLDCIEEMLRKKGS